MDCSLPGSSTHEIFQARILEWVAVSFTRGFFPTQGSNPGLPHCRQTLYCLSRQGMLSSVLISATAEIVSLPVAVFASAPFSHLGEDGSPGARELEP